MNVIYKIYNSHGEFDHYWHPAKSGTLLPDQYCECEHDSIIELHQDPNFITACNCDNNQGTPVETGQLLAEDLILQSGLIVEGGPPPCDLPRPEPEE